MTLLENFIDIKKEVKLHIFSIKFKFSSFLVHVVYLPSDSKKQVLVNIFFFFRDETCLFLKPTLNNVCSTIFMWDGFLAASKRLANFSQNLQIRPFVPKPT